MAVKRKKPIKLKTEALLAAYLAAGGQITKLPEARAFNSITYKSTMRTKNGN